MLIKAANFWCGSQVLYLDNEEKIYPLATLWNTESLSGLISLKQSFSSFGNLIGYRVPYLLTNHFGSDILPVTARICMNQMIFLTSVSGKSDGKTVLGTLLYWRSFF
jgi:hypothetical protein